MLVSFYKMPQKEGTDEQGLPLYRDAVMIRIFRDSTHIVERLAEEDDFGNYPAQYAHFQRTAVKNNSIDGFPVDMWSVLTPADAENLKAHGIHTVQELALKSPAKFPQHLAPHIEAAKMYVNAVKASGGDFLVKLQDLQEANKVLAEENATLRKEIEKLKSVKAA